MKGDGEEEAEDAQPLELFLVKGNPLSIQNLVISADDVAEITFHTGSDMCSHWLKIAYDHLLMTEKASGALADAKKIGVDEDIGDALKLEFSSGMQAVVASGIAIDAFYASVKEYISIPPETAQAWREKKIARHRYKQISEMFRLAFHLNNVYEQSQRKFIKDVFDLRNKAVHPSSETSAPALHPQLNKLASWWYAAFRFQNAKAAVTSALVIIIRLAASPKKEDYVNLDLAKYCRALVVKTKPLIDAWEKQYGVLFEDTA